MGGYGIHEWNGMDEFITAQRYLFFVGQLLLFMTIIATKQSSGQTASIWCLYLIIYSICNYNRLI